MTHPSFDGGAQPNPGVGGAGVVLMDDQYNVVVRRSSRLRVCPVTNNQAEYTALVAGLLAVANEGHVEEAQRLQRVR